MNILRAISDTVSFIANLFGSSEPQFTMGRRSAPLFSKRELSSALAKLDYDRLVDDLLERLRIKGEVKMTLTDASVERFIETHSKTLYVAIMVEVIQILELRFIDRQSAEMQTREMYFQLIKMEEFFDAFMALVIGATTLLAGGERETAMKCLKDSLAGKYR